MSGLMTGRWSRPAAANAPAPIALSLLVVVQNALAVAWRVLLEEVEKGLFSLCEADEDDITERLYMILGEMHAAGEAAVSGLSQFETPVREGNMRSHDRKHKDKQPDLAFRPLRGYLHTSNTVPTAIFIECKPIDHRHPLPSTYCRAGLIRFVNGEYAWAVDRAMMVGYVRNLCALPGGLSTCLDDALLASELALHGSLETLSPTAFGDIVCQSKHRRAFALQGSLVPAGIITVHHLWLRPLEPCEQSRCRDNSAKSQ